MPKQDETKPDDRRVTVPISEFRANPSGVAQQALTREVAIVVDKDTQIIVARKLAPLE